MSRIHVDVSFTVKRKPIPVRRVRELVGATLKSEHVSDALISVAFVGETSITRLNRGFLSHEGPTDVLSFGLTRAGKTSPVIGDIYVCPGVALRNARALRISPANELARLVIHGTLHILGYDHPDGEERTSSAMWRRQERILASSS